MVDMGLDDASDLVLALDKAKNKKPSSENLLRLIDRVNPKVIIIDSLMLWEKTCNENSYSETYEVLGRYTQIAKDRNVSIIFTHHSPKSAQEGSGDGALGSTAFFGAVDTKIQISRLNGFPHIKVDHRNERSLEPRPIYIDRENGSISLSKPVLSKAEARIRDEIITMLSSSTEPIKDSEIKKITGKSEAKVKVLELLCAEGIIFRNPDKPVTYIFLGMPSPTTVAQEESLHTEHTIESWDDNDLQRFIDFHLGGGKCE